MRLLTCQYFFLVTLLFIATSCANNHSINAPSEQSTIQFADAAIQRAAASALGEREGTIIVMNPRDGRIRAVVNPRLAFEQAFPPGSAIKPFTALVALRSGTLDQDTRIQCKTNFQHENFQIACSHKKVNNSFKLHHALAYSCNYFFATVAERINAASFFSTLDNFGFGNRTGINAAEAEGKLQQSEWQISTALGNDEKIQVTPIQLLNAYTALVNGGKLLRPKQTDAENFALQEIRSININQQQRALLIQGMQSATAFGTAADVGFERLPFDVIGKTGTSGASNGFRTQGWFVSFLLKYKSVKNVEPDDLHLACIVFLKRAHGSEAASVAADFYRQLLFGKNNEAKVSTQSGSDGFTAPQSAIRNPQSLSVHLVRENKTVEVNLEEYVCGILAAEASVETELEALKAQAIISRTYALKNRGRHKNEGYDFCSLTHCQRYVAELADHNKALILQAANETAEQTLQDERDTVADVYFHAACGGMTTNLEAVWGKPSPSYLQAVRDDYCTTMSHKNWTQNIPAQDLLRALQSNEDSNVGKNLENIFVTKRDQSGRAETITIEGERRKRLRGWDFALIVNRVLGWNMLKSSRFEIARNDNSFLFRGSGFGHGLGLCQEGAHVMARRGASFQKIIEHYFPGASLSKTVPVASAPHFAAPLFLFVAPAQKWLTKFSLNVETFFATTLPQWTTTSSEHFRLNHEPKLSANDSHEILQTLEAAHKDLLQRTSPTSVNLSNAKFIQIYLYSSTGDFVGATGQWPWVAGATSGNIMRLQPLAILRKRGILRTTLRHELAHAMLAIFAQQMPPRWLAEGLAIHFAGEGRSYTNVATNYPLAELEQKLQRPSSALEMRQLYGAAYREVRKLIGQKGESSAWKLALKSA